MEGLQFSITEVPAELTPAALPSNLIPDLVVTIQPADMVFTTPAPLTFPNRSGYAPGALLDLWSINPSTGFFDNVGKLRVSEDGSLIETISGGIRTSSWHFPAPGRRRLRRNLRRRLVSRLRNLLGPRSTPNQALSPNRIR